MSFIGVSFPRRVQSAPVPRAALSRAPLCAETAGVAVTASRDGQDPYGPLVLEIQQGVNREENYARLHECLRPGLLRQFSRWGFRDPEAEDLCQEVFVNVHKGIGRFEGRCRFSAWVREIAKNVYNNEVRRRRTESRDRPEVSIDIPKEEDARGRAPEPVAPGPSPHDEAESREALARLRRAIAALPPQMRLCVELRVYQDLPEREIGRVMKISRETVKAHLVKARKRLRLLEW